MTILDNGTRDQYVATASQTVFPYTFEVFVKEDLAVKQNGTLLSEGTDYTVSNVGNDSGGNVTLTTGATAGDTITIYRDMELARESDFQQSGDFLASEINANEDRQWAALQQVKETSERSIRAAIDDTKLNSTNTELADVATRAGKVLGFDSAGGLEYVSANIATGDWTYFSTVAAMQLADDLQVGDVVVIGERANSLWDITTATANGYDILEATGSSLQAQLRVVGCHNVVAYGAKGDGATDDSGAIQAAIDAAQSVASSPVLFSNGSTNNTFGGSVYLPAGTYKVNQKIAIAAIAEEQATLGLHYGGVRVYGDSKWSTVIDGSGITADNTLSVEAAGNILENFQIKDSTDNGLYIDIVGKSAWDTLIRNIYINNPTGDGIWFDKAFQCIVDNCLVYNAGGYGFSFNEFHTSMTINKNYALACTSGGFFVGDRVTPASSKGIIYSSFTSNACDGGTTGYTLYGARAVSMNGNGCEVVSGDAIFISGSDSNVTIDGFLCANTGGRGVYAEGNRTQVSVNNFTDSTPTNPTTVLFRHAGTDGKMVISNYVSGRTGGLCSIAGTAQVYSMANDYINTAEFSTGNEAQKVCLLTDINETSANIYGSLLVRALSGSARSDTAQQEATYSLIVSISAAGKSVVLAAEAGAITATNTLPAFNWSIDSNNNLVATHKNGGSYTGTRNFTFELETSKRLNCGDPV